MSFIARPLSYEYATLNATHCQHSAFLASGVASRHGIEAPSRAPPMTLGNMRVRFVHWFAAVCVAAVTTACAPSIDENILSPYSEPGRYDFLDCATISKTLAKVSYTEKQLAQLMSRASETADGAFVNAIAYQDRYNTARAEIRALRKAGEAKKCSQSDLNPAPVAPPD